MHHNEEANGVPTAMPAANEGRTGAAKLLQSLPNRTMKRWRGCFAEVNRQLHSQRLSVIKEGSDLATVQL